MKKRDFLAIIMAVFFVLFTLNVFSDENGNGENNSGQATSTGSDIYMISAQDVTGVYVPE
ncbi:MAG: hypothetical protein FJY07_09555 [Bacteroidetes bacterium]|nr:hypothetical protein [Bacteroidota bacterium]